MRAINYIVVHCTATDTTRKAKGFYSENKTPMFHYVIERNGEAVKLSSDLLIVKAIENYDNRCIHIAYIGGINHEGEPIDNRSIRQKESLFYKLVELSTRYAKAKIVGASDLGGLKISPCFDVKDWLRNYEPTLALDDELLEEEFLMAA